MIARVAPVGRRRLCSQVTTEVPGKQDFGTVKHMEHRGGGVFRIVNDASETAGPLVASIQLEPTITLTNALPYDATISVFEVRRR